MNINREKVCLAMARKCYKTKDLAKKMGISRSRVNTILNSVNIQPSTIGKIAAALDVDVTEIIE